jgi:hypothetical protein
MNKEIKDKANGAVPPQPDEKYVDGKFVDIEIADDYIVLCGTRLERKKISQSDATEWKRQWEFIKKKLAVRGPMATANIHGSPFDALRKMLERDISDDMDAYRRRMLRQQ